MVKQQTLVDFLKKQNPDAKFLDKLKIIYRPYICPFNELLNEIPKNKSVFDIGCGSGQFALLVAEYCSPNKIKGIEIADELVKNANFLLKPYSTNISITFEKFSGDDIPKDISDYDFVTMIDVGHHVPKKIQIDFFKQLYQKMVTGSTLIYKDINADSPFVYANKFHDLLLSSEIGNEMSLKFTLNLFKEIGFEIIKSSSKRMFWYPHFTIIAKK